MKICAAQTRPFKGNIEKNIERHIQIIEATAEWGVDMIVFPELSLTGYEPGLAKELATYQDDSRFNIFQTLSTDKNITIGVGIPVKNGKGVSIGMVLFKPDKNKQIYFKQYLHPDEESYFIAGQNLRGFKIKNTDIALSICYELSVPQHLNKALKSKPVMYVSSVAKSASGVENAVKRLSYIAHKQHLPVIMANCLGPSDDFISVGMSSAWNNQGELLEQLNDSDEGLLLYDTEAGNVIKKYF
jgi:predicted amidohydrolase